MELFLKTLLALSLGGSLMAVLLYGLKLLLGRRLSSTAYYYLWLLVLLRFVLPMPGFMPSVYGSDVPAAETIIAETRREPREIRHYAEPEAAKFMASEDDEPPIVPNENVSLSEIPYNAGIAMPEFRLPEPITVLFSLWALGAVAYMLLSAIGYLRFCCALRRNSLSPEIWEWRCYRAIHDKDKPELIKSPYVSTPMLMGIFRPCLVLPDREYTEEILTNIFLHELKHYSRRDLIYKWAALAVLSLHWFNPLTYLIRREINRACETSCDEMLIAGMDREQRQSYGETLISLAARRPLPAGIVATSFAMEKRDLKERLSRIMKYKKRNTSIIAAILALLLLAGCGAAMGPVTNDTAEVREERIEVSADSLPAVGDSLEIVKVSTVDELLAAIGPDRVIQLSASVYDFTEAEGYGSGKGENWYWQECYDGFELVIQDVENLSFEAAVDVAFVTRPRYANVLSFKQCSNIGIDGIIMGHTIEDGFCTGGVLNLDSCNNVNIDSSIFYGCGTVGIWATNCDGVYAAGCEIYDCSSYGVNAISCRDVVIEDSSLHSNKGGNFQSVFRAESCEGFTVLNCSIFDNEAQNLLRSAYSQQVSMLGCTVEDNFFTNSVIHALGYSPVIDQCSIADTDNFVLYGDLPAVDKDGKALSRDDFEAMEQSKASNYVTAESDPVKLDESINAEGVREVSVSTVDEFLAAIGDHTVIRLEAELFDLSTASNYGAYGGDNYYWIDIFDGPGLVISGVNHLSIIAENDCTIAAIPRYANVLSFINCENITLTGFTAGHTEEPGECAGGVLDFQDCRGIGIVNCRLYGCGILGISAKSCSNMTVLDSEIYDCSQGAISLSAVTDASFNNMDIHDCHSPEISVYGCKNLRFEGDEISKQGLYRVVDGKATEFVFPE